MRPSNVIPIAIVAAGLILAIAVYLTLKVGTPLAPLTGNSALVRPVDTTDHILGNPAAEIKIVEYSDFDCPHCATFNATLHQIVSDYAASGKVAWVFRNFALTELYPNSKKHAEAAECVALGSGNSAYFTFNDALFANQPVDPIKYAELARAAGASPNAVATCIQNAAALVDPGIDADRQNALALGAQGTPYSLIIVEGKAPIIIDGAWGYADLKDEIERALAELK
ncbi:MAG: thioredoxin domain-containing protein [bacterium]|nr:thioredoxin domain-containing protein [bacterium]